MKFSNKVASLQQSPTLALNAKAKERGAKGLPVFNLTAGEPDIETPDFIVDYVAGKLKENKYTPAAGLPQLREVAANYYQGHFKQTWVKPENIVVTAGAKPALTAIFMCILNDGDEVIVPTPAWVSYKAEVEVAGGKAVFVKSTKDFDLDINAINKAITPQTKAIIVNSPNNPTGASYSKESLDKLAELLIDNDIYVISDDIYSRLIYKDIHLPLNTSIPKDKLVIINGFSKSQGLTGWRIGYIVTSRELTKKLTSLLSHTNGNAPVTAQHAGIAALNNNDEPEFIEDLKEKREITAKLLGGIKGIDFKKPDGGFYYFVDISKITTNSALFCQDILEKYGVVLVPGEAFEAPGYFRLSFACSNHTLEDGIKLIDKFIKGE